MKLHEQLKRMKTLMKENWWDEEENYDEHMDAEGSEAVTTGRYFYHGSAATFDRFDIDKVGTGEGVSKYGHGIYFTRSFELAKYYAVENSVGQLKGFNVYKVVVPQWEYFHDWNESVENIQYQVINQLTQMGKEDDAETIQRESGDNGYDFWTMESLYQYLDSTLGGEKEATRFLVELGVPGITATGVHAGKKDTIYVAFESDDLRIDDVTKVR